MNGRSHLEQASIKGRMKSHVHFLRAFGRTAVDWAHRAAAKTGDAQVRLTSAAAAQRFCRQLDQEMEVTIAQAEEMPAADPEAFAALVHAVTQKYVRAVIKESARVLKAEDV